MRYYIKPTELQEISDDVSGDLKCEFNEQIDKLMQLKNILEWEGCAKNSFNSSFEIKVDKLKQFSNIIDGIANYMSYCSKKYNSSTDEVESECTRYGKKNKDDMIR